MLLKDGIATVYTQRDVSGPGDAPRYEREIRTRGYYAELSYETSPTNPTDRRTEQKTDARVRIRQCRSIREDDAVQLESFHEEKSDEKLYKVIRAFHGMDEESGLPISDLSLEEVDKA